MRTQTVNTHGDAMSGKFMKQIRGSPAMRYARCLLHTSLISTAVLIAGCANLSAQDATPAPPSQEPVSQSSEADDSLRAAQVYVYPANDQSPEQLDRDRYECYLWATKQSGFDPSQPSLAPHQRVEVVAAPPAGADTVAGAITGAVVGAMVSNPRHAGTGAAVGAVIGGVLGSASDTARAQDAQRVQRGYDQREAERLARVEQQSGDYRRALTACLEGRGYTVK
jgi:hypothetical protein